MFKRSTPLFIKNYSFSGSKVVSYVFIFLITASSYSAKSQIIWNTGSTTFTKTAGGQQDCITAQTCLTRITVLYNSMCETVSGNQGCSYPGPCNTEWAYGDITNWNTLTYRPLFTVNGCTPTSMVGNPLVCHLIAENIYLQITFNSWTAGGGNFSYTRTTGSTLPIILSNFVGYNQGGSNNLSWSSSTESNFSHYNVQRSSDGFNFLNLAQMNSKAPDGNSTITLNYSFTDLNSLQGYNYYRLEQVDKDGRKQYSKVISITVAKALNSIDILQNFVDQRFQISLSTEKRTVALIKILDFNGRILRNEEIQLQAGINIRDLDIASLVSGLYIVQIQMEGALSFSGKILKK